MMQEWLGKVVDREDLTRARQVALHDNAAAEINKRIDD